MKELTQNDLDLLSTPNIYVNMQSAWRSKVVFGVKMSEACKVFDVYNKVFGAHEYDTHCGDCVVRVYGAMWTVYEDAMKKQEQPKAVAKKKSSKKK